MCNIWKMDWINEMDIVEFREKMKDLIFKKIEAVGINGGEPTLVKNLDEYAEALLELPSIKHLNIISHGFNQKQFFPFLEKTYKMCNDKGVHFSVIISLDGYSEVHNTVRGLKVGKIVSDTIQKIQNNPNTYYHEFEAACNLVKQNVNILAQLDPYSKEQNIRIKYRLGIENKRIESNKLTEQFSIKFTSEVQSAKEFFHFKSLEAKYWYEKFKYYSIFSHLNNPKEGRWMGCDYKNEGITIDSRGAVYYCAVASETIGSLREAGGESIFFDPKNLNYRKQIVDNNCKDCIHDYRGKAEVKYVLRFLKEYFYEKFYPHIYRLKLRF